MNSIIDSVTASRRLKIFMTYCVMTYVVLNLLLNLLKNYVSFFGGGTGALVYAFISLLVKAPLIYGMVRGIVTKNYKFSSSLGAFGEVKNYGVYAAYAIVNITYEIIYALIDGFSKDGGTLAAVAGALSVILIVARLLINFYLVELYFESIDVSGKLALGKSIKGCSRVLGKYPLKVLGAELLMLASNAVAFLISSTFISMLPKNDAVSLIILSLNDILYGFLILVWPVYYLYYRYLLEE